MDIRQIIEQAQEGSLDAFEALLTHHEKRLLAQAIVLCGNESTGMDLAQETLIEAWKSIRRFNHTCRFSTWLYAILMNRYRKMLRRQRSRPTLTLIEPPEEALPRVGTTPAETFQSLETAQTVASWLEALPESQRDVVRMRFFGEADLQDIAAALDCSVGTVKSRLFYGLKALRKKLKTHEPFPAERA
ncbi:MAG: sigma-70 family RNA polymerase sigma factor [Verrucomicrobiota bacterium]